VVARNVDPGLGESDETVPIRSTAFVGVQQRLGAYPITRPFELAKIVMPVSLVDSDITLNAAATTPLLNVPFTASELVAPAANTRLADTGALPAGNYTFLLMFSANDPNAFRIRRRNATDTGDIWAYRMQIGTSIFHPMLQLRCAIQLNERLVIEIVAGGAAGTTYNGVIFASLSP
jgi:hypothetical protein